MFHLADIGNNIHRQTTHTAVQKSVAELLPVFANSAHSSTTAHHSGPTVSWSNHQEVRQQEVEERWCLNRGAGSEVVVGIGGNTLAASEA